MRVGWSWWSLRDTGSPLGLLRFTPRVGTLNVTIFWLLSRLTLTLVCGDLNSVFDRSLDRRGSNALGSSRKSSNALKSSFQ